MLSGIQKIVDSVNSLLQSVRTPVIPIPAILLLCTVFRRPGISPMLISANVIKRQSEFGAPTGSLPDGSRNMMNSLIYVMTEEIINELQKSCVIESVIPPGTVQMIGTGANGGGPVVVTSTNTLPIKATGILR
jgi:hypothetical protein